MPQIKLSDGVHILDDSKGWWVIKAGGQELRVVRSKVADHHAVKAMAEACIYVANLGIGQAESHGQLTGWSGLVKEVSILTMAERVGDGWFLVVDLHPFKMICCYLVGPDGQPSPRGDFNGTPDSEVTRLKVQDMLAEIRTEFL